MAASPPSPLPCKHVLTPALKEAQAPGVDSMGGALSHGCLGWG